MVKDGAGSIYGGGELGTGKPRDREEEFLSQIIIRLNELFVTDGLSDQDLISYAHQSQMMQYLNSKELQAGFQRVVFDMLLAKNASEASENRD